MGDGGEGLCAQAQGFLGGALPSCGHAPRPFRDPPGDVGGNPAFGGDTGRLLAVSLAFPSDGDVLPCAACRRRGGPARGALPGGDVGGVDVCLRVVGARVRIDHGVRPSSGMTRHYSRHSDA
jgi:hypothetical protein